MNLSIDSEANGIVCVKLDGSVTQKEITPLGEPLGDMLGPEGYQRRVCLDLSNAAFLDSSGINWLITCHRRFRERGGKFVIHSLPPLVMNVVKVLKMHKVFDIADSSDAARLHAESKPAAESNVAAEGSAA